MKGRLRGAIGLAILAIAVFSENLFGRQANDLFLLLPGIDKVLHTAEYLAVFLAVFWLLRRGVHHPRQRIVLTCVIGALLAIIDEFSQQLFADRNFEMLDLAANMAGLTLGWVAVARPRLPVAIGGIVIAVATTGYGTYVTHDRLVDYAQALQHERRHEFSEARTYYLRAVDKGVRNPSIYNELAWVSIEGRAGLPEEAVGYARLAYEQQPENPDVLDTYGWALHYAGRSREALPYLEAAFERNPEIFCIHYHLGEVYDALGSPERAAAHFRKQMALHGTREATLATEALSRLNARQKTSGPAQPPK